MNGGTPTVTVRAAGRDTHCEVCHGTECPCYLEGIDRGGLPPFHTVDWNGNVYRIEHGNVATDAPTSVTLVPLSDGPPPPLGPDSHTP
jgi:hypothetical protein